MKVLNKFINSITTPEQRKYIKQIGAPAYNAIMKTSVGSTINSARDFYTSSVKPVIKATQSVNNKSTTRAGLDPNKSTVLKSAPKGSIFKGDIQQSIINLGRNDEIGAKARQDLVMFIISLGLPAPEAALVEKTVTAVARTKGAQAAVTFGKQIVSKVQKAAPKQITAEVRKAITTTRNELVRANPKANALINKGTRTLKSKQKEVSDALDLIFDRQTKIYRIADQLPSTLKAKTPGQLSGEERKLITDQYKELKDFLNKSEYQKVSLDDFLKDSAKFSDDELMNLADFSEKYLKSQKLLTTKAETKTIDKAANKGIGSLSEKETDSYIDMLRKNSDQLNDLRKKIEAESGEKMKKSDIPKLFKFANEFGDIIKNSPSYIKSQFTGANLAGQMINLGLSIYDIWTAFNENGDTLLPKAVANTARVGSGALIPNPILKILFGGLGYLAGDKLATAALQKVGVKHNNSDIIEKEKALGIYQEGLHNQVAEFEQGASGRKYHVVGNKIYNYASGLPVIIEEALTDISNYYTTGAAQLEERYAQNEKRKDQLIRQMKMGYNIDPSQLQRIEVENTEIKTKLDETKDKLKKLAEEDYDPNGDLGEQYKQRVVDPEVQNQQASALERMRQLDQEAQSVYSALFKKVQEDTLSDLDKFYTPEALAVDYYQHQRLAARGQMPYMTREEFANWKKLQDLKTLEPQIRQQAAAAMQNMIKSEADLRNAAADLQAKEETARHNVATENIDSYKAQIDAAYKSGQITIDQYKALTDRLNSEIAKENAETNKTNAETSRMKLNIDSYNAETGRMNARTNEEAEKRLKSLVPFQQGNYIGQTVMNIGMQDNLKMDQVLNSNQSVFSQVFPGTQQNSTGNSSIDNYQKAKQRYNQLNQQ